MDYETSKESFVASDLVAFNKFRTLLNEPFDEVEFAGERPDAHHCPDLVADGARVHIDREASDDAAGFKPANALRHARCGHADKAGKLAHRQAGIGIECTKNLGVRRIRR